MKSLLPVLIAVAVILGAAAVPAAAAPDAPLVPDAPPGVAEIGPDDLLVTLQFPELTGLTVPAHLEPEQAADYARTVLSREAAPLLADLDGRRKRGEIAAFTLRPDLHAVVVRSVAGEPGSLPDMLGVTAVTSGQGELTCGAEAAEALTEQVLARSRLALRRAEPRARLAPAATDPSIELYVPPGAAQGTYWSSVSGQAQPGLSVTVRILRSGALLAEETTYSSDSGHYEVSPDWQDCPTAGYRWRLQPGDVVSVTAGGKTATTTAVDVLAWVDPETNIVAGSTEAGRSVRAEVWQFAVDPCLWNSVTGEGMADAVGQFSLDMTPQVDIHRAATVYVYSADAQGNASYYYFTPFGIRAQIGASYFYAYLKPATGFTATVRRGGGLLVTTTGRSTGTGSTYINLRDAAGRAVYLQAGDDLEVSFDAANIRFTMAPQEISLDPLSNRATGVTGPNRLVRASFERNYSDWNVQTTCNSNYACGSAFANASGAFSVQSTIDFERGDYAYVYIYDAERNVQYANELRMAALVADVQQGVVRGVWSQAGIYLQLLIKDSAGAIKRAVSDIWADSYDGSFSWWDWSPVMAPGDEIEISDGTRVERMTVQQLTARLDDNGASLTVGSAGGQVIANTYDFRRADTDTRYFCSAATVSAGSVSVSVGGAQVGAQDFARVWLRGPDGHYTFANPFAFTMYLNQNDQYLSGYTETPLAQLTLTHARGGASSTYPVWADRTGYYSMWLTNPLATADVLTAQTTDGDSAHITIPPLSIATEPAANRVYGSAAANEPVEVELRRWIRNGWYSQSQVATADATGKYSASFADLVWPYDCSAAQVGHPCSQPVLYYHTSDEHRILLEGPQPTPVAADSYEDDDVAARANPYVGPQQHTLHENGEVDWVSFAVTAADVARGRTYEIDARKLGWDLGVAVRLFASDATTLLAEQWRYRGWQYQSGSAIHWRPSAPGTYYVQVALDSTYSSSGYCDGQYELVIEPRYRMLLPVLAR